MLDVSTFLERGQKYTMSLSASTWTYLTAGAFNVQGMDSALSGISNISQASAWSPAKLSSQVNVTFVYVGDGADVVAGIFQEIADAFESGFGGTFDYVGMEQGTVGAGVETPQLPDLTNLLPSTSGLWAVAVIAALGIFLFSGGAGVVRRIAA